MEKLLYDVKSVCFVLSLGKTKIYELIQAGKLVPCKVDGKTMFKAERIKEYLKSVE